MTLTVFDPKTHTASSSGLIGFGGSGVSPGRITGLGVFGTGAQDVPGGKRMCPGRAFASVPTIRGRKCAPIDDRPSWRLAHDCADHIRDYQTDHKADSDRRRCRQTDSGAAWALGPASARVPSACRCRGTKIPKLLASGMTCLRETDRHHGCSGVALSGSAGEPVSIASACA